MISQENYVDITIFGVSKENISLIDEIFSEYNPSYIGSNSYRSIFKLSQKDEEINSDDGNGIELYASSIKEALSHSTGNWIYARFERDDFNRIPDLQSKIVLRNNEIIYCMEGLYHCRIDTGPLKKLEKKMENSEKKEPYIYKMPEYKCLTNLPFEGKSINLKFNEFILGNYTIDRKEEIKKDEQGSSESIFKISLIIFLIIFIFKLSQ